MDIDLHPDEWFHSPHTRSRVPDEEFAAPAPVRTPRMASRALAGAVAVVVLVAAVRFVVRRGRA